MRSEEELTRLFTEYFGDRLSIAQIDTLVTDVRVSAQGRRTRTLATGQTAELSGLPADATPHWRRQFAF
jgi:hypothetical protein